MKKLVLMMAVLTALAGCSYRTGNGNVITETRNVQNFDALKVGGGIKVDITIGAPAKVTVEADDNIIEDIRTTVKNGELNVFVEDGLSIDNAVMTVKITVDELRSIKSSASATINVNGELKGREEIALDASSASSIKASVDAPAVKADASSGAEIVLTGKTRSFSAESSSGATVKASNLLSENTKARASSGATALVHASVDLDAHASSGGSVDYRGEAQVVKKENSGGSINRKD